MSFRSYSPSKKIYFHHFPTKMENSGRCGVLCEIPSVVGVWIFFGTTHFLFKRIFRFIIKYSWISKLLHKVAITRQLRDVLRRFYNLQCTCTFWVDFAIWTLIVLEKALMFCNSLRDYIHAFVAKLSDRHFCWFLAAMLVPIQIGIIFASLYGAL